MLNTLLKRTAKDIAIYFPGKLLPALTGLITVPIFARLFRPEDYGVLAVVGVFTSVGGIAVANWLTSSVMRFLPYYKQKNQLDQFYSTLFCAFSISLLSLLLLGIPIYLIIKDNISPKVFWLLPLAGLIIAVNSLYAIIQTILRADQKAKHFVYAELFVTYGGLAIGLSLVLFFRFGVEGILWGGLFATALASVGIVCGLLRVGTTFGRRHISAITLKEFASYGLPGGLATVGTWLLSISDRYVIEYFRGTTEVGLYAMGYGIADRSINLIISSLALAIGPILIDTWEGESRAVTVDLLRQITRMTLILVIPIVVGLSIFAVPILRVFTTTAYLPAASVLPWVASGSLMYGLNLQAYTGLIVAKKTVVMARNYILAGLANVVLNVLFVPPFGFIAAAVNTTVAYGVLLVLNIFSSQKYLPWLFPWRSLCKVLGATASMTILLCGWRVCFSPNIVSLIISVLVGAGIYFIMLTLLRELSDEEMLILRKISKKLWRGGIEQLTVWVNNKK